MISHTSSNDLIKQAALLINSSILIFFLIIFFQVWCINSSAKTQVPKEDIGNFFSGDCYIILYTYHSGDRKDDYFLCCWFGKDSIEVNRFVPVREFK